MKASFIIRLGLILLFVSTVYPCRMLGVIALPGEFLSDRDATDNLHPYLVAELEEFRLQGGSGSWPYNNRDGWAMISYPGTESEESIQVVRSELEAYEDEFFDEQIALLLAPEEISILMGHLRQGTSGADDIPNPHPFIYVDPSGVEYSFAHNGDMNKEVLRDMIGDDWLAEHPPQTYGGGPWDASGWDYVVDSELFFFWIMKNIEESSSIVNGIKQAMQELEVELSFDIKNFLMSDGIDLYAYRSSPIDDIYYFDGSEEAVPPWFLEFSNHRAVMSTPPPDGPMADIPWIELADLHLLILKADGSSEVLDAMTPIDILVHQQQPLQSSLQKAYPNPFNASTVIPAQLRFIGDLELKIYNTRGVQVYSSYKYVDQPGQYQFIWAGQDNQGKLLQSGSYFYQLQGPELLYNGKLLLLK
ncbi:class II glutamine amidotransferase [bacterium]|nr:class II glutamine amidotransferase [bacterium]